MSKFEKQSEGEVFWKKDFIDEERIYPWQMEGQQAVEEAVNIILQANIASVVRDQISQPTEPTDAKPKSSYSVMEASKVVVTPRTVVGDNMNA